MAQTLMDDASPLLPSHLLERLPEAQATAEANAAEVSAKLSMKGDEFNRRAEDIQYGPGAHKGKLRKLYRLANDIGAVVGSKAACKKGCSHCCHIPVAMFQSEADLIAEEIGVPAARIKQSVEPSDRGFGYHMPCPFLKNNACSIYEHRPIACRTLYNMDKDALLCELLPDMTVPVPYANMAAIQSVYVVLNLQDKMGDIRDFFPTGTKKK